MASHIPKISKNKEWDVVKVKEGFPLNHYSYSSFVKFSTSPLMFKIRYINHENIETENGISSVIGKTGHLALQNYYFYKDDKEVDEIKKGLEIGINFLHEYDDNYIQYNTIVPNKQRAIEIFSFAYTTYITEKREENCEIVSIEEEIDTEVDVIWSGKRLRLPIRLKGIIDKLIRNKSGKGKGMLTNVDYKFTKSFSDPDKIDGAKILQAIQYYFLILAKYGEAPYSMKYEEIKTSKNQKKEEPQIKEYEIVYEENKMFFDFYFRFYEDVTKAVNGEAVFVPNINDFYDNEVAIIAYTYRLDETEEKAKQMIKMKVDNITDLLRQKIHLASNMSKLMKTAEKKFVSAKNLNYNKMTNEEKIRAKLMEHGMLVNFDEMIEGYTFDLYKYTPSIGLKMSKIMSYVADIEQVMGVSGIRILAPIPNTTMIGFEVPRKDRKFIETKPSPDGFNISMGVNILGEEYKFDIRKAPHMLIAGATGSGKSVFINSLIDQISKIGEVDIHLFDPKLVELRQFKSIAKEYYSGSEDIYLALSEIVNTMNYRYEMMAETNSRNIEEHNLKATTKLRYKIVVIDEFGDLIVGSTESEEKGLSKDIMRNVLLLAQKARACGIHMIIATQRPSVDIINGSIKANFPTKVAFRMAKSIDSQVLLDESGAEKLLGKGDMLFSSDFGQVRLQGFNY